MPSKIAFLRNNILFCLTLYCCYDTQNELPRILLGLKTGTSFTTLEPAAADPADDRDL